MTRVATGILLLVLLLSGPALRVARAAAGDPDPSFGVAGNATADFGGFDQAFAVAIQADGKIVLAGSSVDAANHSDFAIARFDASGMPDASFGTGGKTIVDLGGDDGAFGVAVQPDGKIVLVGATLIAGNANFGVVRLDGAGMLDPSFGTGGKAFVDFDGDDTAFAVARQSDGKIVIAGHSIDVDGNGNFAVARLETGGLPDGQFGSGGETFVEFDGFDQAFGVVLQADGKIVVAGTTHLENGDSDFAVARLDGVGAPDPTFNGGTVVVDVGRFDEASAVRMQSDDKIVVAGFASDGTTSDFAVVRRLSNGTRDMAFGTNGTAVVDFGAADQAYGLALQSDGKAVAAGITTISAQNSNFAAARLDVGGLADGSFGMSGKASVDLGGIDEGYATAIQADGKIVVGGRTGPSDGANSDFAVVRLLAVGGTTTTTTVPATTSTSVGSTTSTTGTSPTTSTTSTTLPPTTTTTTTMTTSTTAPVPTTTGTSAPGTTSTTGVASTTTSTSAPATTSTTGASTTTASTSSTASSSTSTSSTPGSTSTTGSAPTTTSTSAPGTTSTTGAASTTTTTSSSTSSSTSSPATTSTTVSTSSTVSSSTSTSSSPGSTSTTGSVPTTTSTSVPGTTSTTGSTSTTTTTTSSSTSSSTSSPGTTSTTVSTSSTVSSSTSTSSSPGSTSTTGSVPTTTSTSTTGSVPTTTSTSTPVTTSTTASTSSTSTTLPPGCRREATYASIRCRADELVAAVEASVPPGPLATGLAGAVTKAESLAGRAETLGAGGKRKGMRAMLGRATRSLARFQKRLRSRKAQTIAADVRDRLTTAAAELATDLRTLRSS
ncbi:MAG TPA: hypothetical protein VKA21_06230 [Candidatus Binatia bacterium]|nr:hypothetical protein [Candidatus Binatia bacterium]